MIRTGIIGRGMAGRIFHGPLIKAVPGLRLDRVVGKSEAADLVADAGIDLIVIATPNETHAELAELALRAGKHVVVDKPFVLELEEGYRLVELAAREGRVLTVFHNRRWDGDFRTVSELVASGRLGRLLLFEAFWDRFRPAVPQGWREEPGRGAGTLLNLAPHMVDQMLLLFQSPDAVQADIGTQRPAARVDDYFAMTFHYGQMRAILGGSNLVAMPRPRFALHGTLGSYVKFGLDPQEGRLAAGMSPNAAAFGNESAKNFGQLTIGDHSERIATMPGSYIDFYAKLVSAIKEGGAPPVDPLDALAGISLIQSASRSALTGEVVPVRRPATIN